MASSEAPSSHRGASRRSASLTFFCLFCWASVLEQKSEAFSIPQQQQCRRRSHLCLSRSTRDIAAHPPLPMDAAPPLVVSQSKLVDFPGKGTSTIRGPDGEGSEDDVEPDFNINVGRALDYLAIDVPLMFSAPPRLEIFTSGVVLKDPVGELCHGRRLYGAVHTSLRVLGAVTAVRPRVGVTSICFHDDRREVELKWTMAANAPFIADNSVKLSAVSVYRVDKHGLIYEHSIDNRIKRDLWEYSHSWMGMLTGDRPPSV